MNPDRLESIVQQYVRDRLSPTKRERRDISKRYQQLRDCLQERTFQSGSYARFTSTTPVNDLDVIYVLPEEITARLAVAKRVDPSKLDLERIIETLADELRRFYGSSASVREQPHSVGIYFGREDEFSIDVVPAIPTENDMYWVPDTVHLSIAKRSSLYKSATPPVANWIRSDPRGYIAQAADVDERSAGRFRKSAKTLKRWRGVSQAGKRGVRTQVFPPGTHRDRGVSGGRVRVVPRGCRPSS